jgi:phage terminase large subunit-like protein
MPSREALVRRLNFCQWLEGHAPFVPYDKWTAARAAFDLSKFRGMRAIGAFDLSATTDLTAFVLLFQLDGLQWLWPMFWIPADGLAERERRDGVPYGDWVRKGHVLTTPGPAIDKDHVVAHVARALGALDISLTHAPFDRHRIDVLRAACTRQGVTWPLEDFGQGFVSMAPAVDALETALLAGTIRHPGNPCLDWNAANAVTEMDAAGNRKVTKAKATGRVDGLVAALMAIGCAASNATKPAAEPQVIWLN